MVPKGPANFSFIFQQNSCDYWQYREESWSHQLCIPALEYLEEAVIKCTCTVLGTYTSYVFNIQTTPVPLTQRTILTVNWILVLIYTFVLTFVFIWLLILFCYYNKQNATTVFCDLSLMEPETHDDAHDILIILRTGGRINSGTTASVRLIFQTVQHTELQINVMQNPGNPVLNKHSNYTLWLRTHHIRIPTRIAVSHNNAGRYPSWYLVSVTVVDIQMGLTQVFILRRWVRRKILILSSAMVMQRGSQRTVESWCTRFMSEFERQWLNWGMWHPVISNWRDYKEEKKMTRFERVAIFVLKVFAVYTVCACYLGPKTDDVIYNNVRDDLTANDILHMFIYAFVVTIIVHLVYVNIPRNTENK